MRFHWKLGHFRRPNAVTPSFWPRNTSALYLYYRRVLAFDQPGESDVEVATVIEHRCAWGLYAVGVGVVVVAMLVGWILRLAGCKGP